MKKTISLVLVLALGLANVSLAAEGAWTRKADLPTVRTYLSTSVVNGKIYAIGGITSGSWTGLSTVEVYDPVTNTWTKKADMPTARQELSTSVVGGKIYAIGGSPRDVSDTSTVEEYDPATDTWTQKTVLRTPRYWFSTSVVEGKIYLIGGQSPSGLWLGTVEAYDPATDTWTRKSDMPTARLVLCTSVVNGKIYAIGGWPVGGTGACGIVEAYDPTTDTWTRKADMPTARVTFSTSVVDGKICAIGGWRHSVAGPLYSTVDVYDPATDTWTKIADIPVATAGLSTSVVDGKIYAIGGSITTHNGTFVHTAAVYVYDIIIDFNGDGVVDSADMCIIVDHWGENYSLCDIGPMPWGDGIVDVQDLVILAEHLFEEVNDPTLLAHWKLDEAEGMVAYDSVGNNDAFVIGVPVWQPNGGQVDGALQLDGIDDCAVTNPVLSPAEGPFSVLAWVKGGIAGQVVISQSGGGVNWLCTDPLEGNLMTELKGPGRGAATLLSQTVITVGDWHRIGLVWDGSHRTLYVDDLAVAEDSQAGLQDTVGGLYIGTGKAMEAGTYWSGLIDDVRIYKRAVKP